MVAVAPSRSVASEALHRSGTAVLAAATLAWTLVLAVLLRHRVFASHDAINNYAHVWYVAGGLWHHHRLPLRMPVLGHGGAYTYPYAFVAWTSAAVLWPVFGDWTVTLWLALGFLGVVGAMFWALPEFRRHPWLAAAALVNPALVQAPFLGQLPFLWATAFLFLAIGAWRRERRPAAAVFAALAQSGHPAVVLPITAGVVLGRLLWEPRRRALLGWWAVSLVPTIPAAWVVLVSPVYQDSSSGVRWTEFLRTLEVRLLVVLVPVILVAVARNGWRWAGPPAFAAILACNPFFASMLHGPPVWQALFRPSDRLVLGFTRSPDFVPGATYRLLQAGGERLGMYQLLRAGGRLDSEFFPESMLWKNFPGTGAYSALLASRRVDFVLDCTDFDRVFATNEHALLEELASSPAPAAGVRTRLVTRTPWYSLYAVRRPAPG